MSCMAVPVPIMVVKQLLFVHSIQGYPRPVGCPHLMRPVGYPRPVGCPHLMRPVGCVPQPPDSVPPLSRQHC